MVFGMNTPFECPQEFIEVANKAADAVAIVHRRYFRNGVEIETKHDGTPVTAADKESERVFRDVIQQHFPGHGIIGEEHPPYQPGSEFTWVVDPIDGTQLFISGNPLFALLIGLAYQGHFILGLIDHAITRERVLGADGHGTFLNGRRIQTRQCENLSMARLKRPGISRYTRGRDEQINNLSDAAHTVMWGLSPYDYSLLAAGYTDVIINSGPKVHDLAPLDPVIRNAGGVVVDWAGTALNLDSPDHFIAVGDPSLLNSALALIEA
jgi:inositol-phosphate phosphatase/L-galactose 1-phosphate phosphatase/histidinol-phosphatase